MTDFREFAKHMSKLSHIQVIKEPEARRKSGAFGMTEGDRFRYDIDGRTGIAGEFMQDGECCVTWDDGSGGMIKWNHMTKIA